MTAPRLDILARLEALGLGHDWPDVLDFMEMAGLVVDIPNFDTDPQPTENDTPRWIVTNDGILAWQTSQVSLRERNKITEWLRDVPDGPYDALVAVVRDHAAVTRERDALRAELVVMRGLHAGAVDAVHELQARLDARGADLGRFTQSAVTKTKELEAQLLAARAALGDTP